MSIIVTELVGILKGVYADGKVGKKELQFIKNWIEINHDYFYDIDEYKIAIEIHRTLFRKVDSSINYDQLSSLLARFNMDEKNSNQLRYQMNGILIGMTCDGEINDKEFEYLTEWIRNSSEYLVNNFFAGRFIKKLRDITELDSVEVDLEAVSFLCNSYLDEQKKERTLSLIKQKVACGKNVGMDLIEILDDKNQVKNIHNSAQNKIKAAIPYKNRLTRENTAVCLMSLALIGMEHYDGNFYNYVRETYSELYNTEYSEQAIEGTIRTILGYHLTEKEIKNNDRKINAALKNAIVPVPFLESFFEFIYDIYKVNFQFSLPENLEEEFEFIYDGLSSSFKEGNNDELSISVTQKTYKLIRATKRLILDKEDVGSVIRLSIAVIKLIDQRVWKNDVEIESSYLKKGFEQWEKEYELYCSRSEEKQKSIERYAWEPKYNLDHDVIYLEPPLHKVKADYSYDSIKVVIKNGENIVYEDNKPNIREIIGGYQITQNRIRITDPLGDLTYCLMSGTKILYSSKNKLKRNFIVFDHDGTEIKNNTDHSGDIIICTSVKDALDNCYGTYEKYSLSYANVKRGDTLFIGGIPFNFTSYVKPRILGIQHENCFIKEHLTQNYIEVFKEVKYINFEANDNLKNLEIKIDNVSFNIEDFNAEKSHRIDVTNYMVTLDFLEDGIHLVSVSGYENEQIHYIMHPQKFAVDSDLKYEFIRTADDKYLVSVDSVLLKELLVEEITPTTFNDTLASFSYLGIRYEYILPFELDIYRIDENSWKSLNDDIWKDDIASDSFIDIYHKDFDEVQFYSDKGELISIETEFQDKKTYKRFKIGFLRTYTENYDYISIMFLNKDRAVGTIRCYNKCIFNEELTSIAFDSASESVEIIPFYYGKGNVYVTVFKEDEEIYRTSPLIMGEPYYIVNMKPFTDYEFRFIEKKKGFGLKKERCIGVCEKNFYSIDDLAGRYFKIEEAEYDQYIRGEFVRKTYNFNKMYIYLEEHCGKTTYIGNIYVKGVHQSFMLENLGDVDVEICSDIINGKMDIAITKDGDGLLLDFEHHGIKDTMDDDNAIDIFSYTINVNGVKNLWEN